MRMGRGVWGVGLGGGGGREHLQCTFDFEFITDLSACRSINATVTLTVSCRAKDNILIVEIYLYL